MLIDLSLNPSKTADEIIRFIKNTVHNSGFSKVVVGLSGGVDSAVSAALAVRALGPSHVYVGFFPYGDLNKGLDDAGLVTKKLNIPESNIVLIDIKPLVDPIANFDASNNNLRKGNIMARIRMILLYDLSKKINGLVLGTENKTEHLLGYYTRFGDEASDIEPIRHLYKTQVKQLATYLGIPEKIIKKLPTAGLWQGQTDEGEFGFSYEEADQILSLYTEKKTATKDLVKRGFSQAAVDLVIDRLNKNNYKQALPYIFPKEKPR